MNEITDKQRVDVRELSAYARENSKTMLGASLTRVLALLPSELTDPQPVLPTEPGYYLDRHESAWLLSTTGDWSYVDGTEAQGTQWVRRCAPFTRLLPERPQITREQIEDVVTADFRLPPWRMSALLALVNGTDRD